jgi:hypothetical protein
LGRANNRVHVYLLERLLSSQMRVFIFFHVSVPSAMPRNAQLCLVEGCSQRNDRHKRKMRRIKDDETWLLPLRATTSFFVCFAHAKENNDLQQKQKSTESRNTLVSNGAVLSPSIFFLRLVALCFCVNLHVFVQDQLIPFTHSNSANTLTKRVYQCFFTVYGST